VTGKSLVRPIPYGGPEYERASQNFEQQWGPSHQLPKKHIYGVYAHDDSLVAIYQMVSLRSINATWWVALMLTLGAIEFTVSVFTQGYSGVPAIAIWGFRLMLVLCLGCMVGGLWNARSYGPGLGKCPRYVIQKLAAVTDGEHEDTQGLYRMKVVTEALINTPDVPQRFLVKALTPRLYRTYRVMSKRLEREGKTMIVLKPRLTQRWRTPTS
jgi:hypothetical protein